MNDIAKKFDTVYVVDAFRSWDVWPREFLRSEAGLAYCRARGESGRGSAVFTAHVFKSQKEAHEFAAAFLESRAKEHRVAASECST